MPYTVRIYRELVHTQHGHLWRRWKSGMGIERDSRDTPALNERATTVAADRRSNGLLLVTLVACLALPLLGVALAGGAWLSFLRFPPQPPNTDMAGFSWPAFVAIALAEVAVIAPFIRRVLTHEPHRRSRQGDWPWWGTAGVVLLVGAWFVAWQPLPSLQPIRMHAFTPLWLGYIVVVNALVQLRTGAAPLTRTPGRFLALFPLSTAFWWVFEYLNQFVGNWHYLGTVADSPGHYLTAASLPFSTVLPAVFSTWVLLASLPRTHAGLGAAWPVPGRQSHWGLMGLIFGLVGLVGIGLWPRWTFPLLWLAPGLVLIGLQLWRSRSNPLSGLAGGDWRVPWLAALAGLICGLFWEMWNAGALARWEYRVPLVHGLELFRMPLLGYGGYLPFGIECLACLYAVFGGNWVTQWLPAISSSRSDGPQKQ